MLGKNLNYYQEEKSKLLQAYARLPEIGSELLNRIDRSSDWINNSVSELESNRFKLFTAGQMNCGKSTLINALLFGKQILPVYDAVMTSAITLIEHVSASPTNQEGFQVEFYSNEEWQAIRAQAQADEQKLNDFVKVQEYVRELGVIPSSVVGTGSKFIAGFDELPAYVTPAMKRREGKYTPFVKSVTIYADNELLRDLVVVDTPGTNDPNEQRARLTEDWIKQADAVVFVSYAGQALPAEDVDFINRFMLHVPSVNRIIAVNKIDTVQGTSELEGYLQDLRDDERESIRQVFSASTPTVMVCALGGLIEGYQGTLPASLVGDRDRLSPLGYLAAERHHMNELRATIEDRLLKNRGLNILDAHRQRIESTRQLALSAIDSDIEFIDNQIFERTNSVESLKNKQSFILNEIENITELSNRFRLKISEIADGQYEKLKSPLIFTEKHFIIIENRLKKIGSINKIEKDANWLQKIAIEEATKEFQDDFKIIWRDACIMFLQEAKILKSDVGFEFISERKIDLILNKAKILNLDKNIDWRDDLLSVISDAQHSLKKFINQLFNTNIGIQKIIENVAVAIRDSIHITLKHQRNEYQTLLSTTAKEFSYQVEDGLNREITEKRNAINKILNDQQITEDINIIDRNKKMGLIKQRKTLSQLNLI